MKWMLFVAIAGCAVAQQPSFVVQVDYMKVAPGKGAEYRKAEEAAKVAVHQDRVKKGMILSWGLYSVRFPAGAAREFDYVTVTTFAEASKMENSYSAEQRKSLSDTGAGALRTLVRSDILSAFATAGDVKASWPWVTVNYIKANPGMIADWRRDEAEAWKAVAEAQVKAGSLTGWVAQSVIWPAGTHREYDFVSVNGRESFIGKPTPGIEGLASNAANRAARHGEAIRRELWRLVSETTPQ